MSEIRVFVTKSDAVPKMAYLRIEAGWFNGNVWLDEAQVVDVMKKLADCLLPMVAVDLADTILYDAREKMMDHEPRRANEDAYERRMPR